MFLEIWLSNIGAWEHVFLVLRLPFMKSRQKHCRERLSSRNWNTVLWIILHAQHMQMPMLYVHTHVREKEYLIMQWGTQRHCPPEFALAIQLKWQSHQWVIHFLPNWNLYTLHPPRVPLIEQPWHVKELVLNVWLALRAWVILHGLHEEGTNCNQCIAETAKCELR